MMGGVTVDGEGRTTLPGLWAAGEVTSTGLHGANRLASNSLLEAMVYGAHAGQGASCAALGMKDDFFALPIENPRVESVGEPLNLDDIRNALKSLLWRNVGVRRDGEGLAEARQTVQALVPLRPGPAVQRPRRLGVAEHDLPGAVDDRGRLGATGEPRRPRPHRLSRGGRSSLEPAYLFPAGRKLVS